MLSALASSCRSASVRHVTAGPSTVGCLHVGARYLNRFGEGWGVGVRDGTKNGPGLTENRTGPPSPRSFRSAIQIYDNVHVFLTVGSLVPTWLGDF